MGLIKGSAGIAKLLVGYPTNTDKYDVAPATLGGSAAVYNGDVVMFDTAHSVYKACATISAKGQIAGIVLATNVKVPSTYPAGNANVSTAVGEAFNLLVRGCVAVALDSGATLASCTEGATVYITSAGKLTNVSTSNVALDWKFTGVTETQGSAKVAEVRVA